MYAKRLEKKNSMEFSLREGQRLAPNEIRELEERYQNMISGVFHPDYGRSAIRSLAEQAPIKLWILGTDGRLLYANQAFLDFIGVTFEKVQDLCWQKIIHPDDLARVCGVIMGAFEKKTGFSVEIRLKRADGNYRWVLSSGYPKTVNGEVEYLGTSQDITSQKLVELKLEAERREIEAAHRRRSIYLTQMTHELRTPLHTIISGSSLCLDELLGPLTPKQAEYLEMINKSGEHLLRLINDMLDMSKIEYGKLSMKMQTLNLSEFLSDTIKMCAPLAVQKKQELVFKEGPGLPKRFTADPLRLRQAIFNLFSNAHKFTPEHKKIELSCTKEKDCLVFSVRDEGPGIPPGDIETIFLPFEQGEQEHLTRTKGLGLGLPIAKRLVELQQGCISIESEPGVGSTFSIYLPLKAARKES